MVFSNIIAQLLYFIGFVFLFGFLIDLLNRKFYSMIGASRTVCYATGFIGTPIHELSHALMCVIFRHRIDEIKLFQIDEESGTLGYVRHAYNEKSLYQRIGNYFIGVAPIIFGTLFLYLLMNWLLPETFAKTSGYLDSLAASQTDGFSLACIVYSWKAFFGMLGAMFTEFTSGLSWWIFMILATCISLHMNLSGADIKNALPALPSLVGFIVVINILLGVISQDICITFGVAMNVVGSYLLGVLLLSLVFALFCLAVAAIARGIIFLVGRVKSAK